MNHHWNRLDFCYNCKISKKDYIDTEAWCGENIKDAKIRMKRKKEFYDTLRALQLIKQ